MNDFVQMPNKGTMFLSKNKKHEKSPDFFGSIHVDKDYLQNLIDNRDSELVEVPLSAWKGGTKNGDPWISLSVDTQRKQKKEKDPWEQ